MSRLSSFSTVGTVCNWEVRDTKFGSAFCRITVELDDGYESLYVHDRCAFQTAVKLKVGQKIKAIGRLQPRLGKEHEPVFLNPTTIQILDDSE